MDRPSGIVYYDSASSTDDRHRVHLPLEEVKVKVLIVDVSAKVILTQIYSNPIDTITRRCKYCFPVPENAAICAFSMTIDGRTITGIAKDANQAREEYEEAIGAGRSAGILDYITDDIFTISIGAIPAQAEVTTKIEYVMSLANDDNADEIRFQLPMGVGERYGSPPPELTSARGPSPRTRIKLTAHIQTSGKILDITSPNHQADISAVAYSTHRGRPSRRRFNVNYRSRSFLVRDFVLIIRAEGLDAPRCFAEVDHDQDGRSSSTIAMQLTVVPKFDLPPISKQEYLFVVDRSGSMAGERISTAKRTLAILLRMLPKAGTIFNIFSFGSKVDSKWPRSQSYDEDSLNKATTYVELMEANYGGTEIRQALQHALSSTTSSVPTAVFVFTDGEAYDLAETLSVVDKAVSNALPEGPLRVFTLGIGDGVSSAMCEGIARAGRGACLFAVNTESIIGKCGRLFRAGRTPFVRKVKIDWGITAEFLSNPATSVNFSIPSLSSRTIRIRPLPIIQQVPTVVQDIHASTRINIFVIIALKKLMVPKSITLRGELDDGSTALEVEIPVLDVQLAGAGGLPLIHTLAAWRLIQEHEEKRAPLPQPVSAATDDQIREAVIVHLGTTYQLASRHTSFVLAHADQHGRQYPSRAGSVYRAGSPLLDSSLTRGDAGIGHSSHFGLRTIFNFFTGFFRHEIHERHDHGVPGAWIDSSPSSPPASDNGVEDDDGYESPETFSTLSSLDGSTEWSDWSATPSPESRQQMTEEDVQRQRSPSPQFEPRRLAPKRDRAPVPSGNTPTLPPPPREVVELVRLQLFDGSFPLHGLRDIVGANAVDEANKLHVPNTVWATALSVAFIEKSMGSNKELMEDLLVKAREFLEERPDVDVAELLRLARALVT